MLTELLQKLQGVTNPFQGYLGEMWTIWNAQVVRAVLLARWHWQQLPTELAQQAAALQQQAQLQARINQRVQLGLGSLGIFSGGAAPGFGMNPNQGLFILTMGTIRAYQGNPPTTPGLAELSEAVLTGQLEPVQALIAVAPVPLQPQLGAAVQMSKMAGLYPILNLEAVVQVGYALPRERIPSFLPNDKLE
jgi:hypothetical protein